MSFEAEWAKRRENRRPKFALIAGTEMSNVLKGCSSKIKGSSSLERYIKNIKNEKTCIKQK